jgi:pyruvate dehydrogenase E1 component alpha subunit
LIEAGVISLDDYKALDGKILDRIETEIIRYAEESPEPDVAELERYVLAEDDPWVMGGSG